MATGKQPRAKQLASRRQGDVKASTGGGRGEEAKLTRRESQQLQSRRPSSKLNPKTIDPVRSKFHRKQKRFWNVSCEISYSLMTERSTRRRLQPFMRTAASHAGLIMALKATFFN